MPVVTGFFSGFDLRTSPPAVELDTGVHAVNARPHQTLAWIVAALAIGAALLLVAFDRRPARPAGVRSRVRASARPADAVVAVALLGWWVLSPAFWDDGWITARERMFEHHGGFSSYYDALAGNLPVAYWLEWSQQWLTQSVDSLLWLRVPSLLLLAATWVLCRWILARIAAPSRVALWALTAAFLVGAMAGGMTLRPEPVTAFFLVAVLACVVRFRERESAAPLALVAALVPFAILGHPAGIVTLAPLLVVAPSIVRFARANIAVAGTLIASGIGLFAVLAFVGSDLDGRRFDAQWTRTYGPHAEWRDEFLRYTWLQDYAYGTPMRRLAVALIGLAVLGFLLRRRRNGLALIDLPAASLGLTLILQIATPSRHPFQFGALLGLAAIAVAAETARLRDEEGGWSIKPFVVLGAATLAAAWAWSPRHGWNPLDLRTVDWTPGIEDRLPLQSLAIALPFLLLAGGLLVARRRRDAVAPVSWRVAAWTAPVLALPLVVFTAGVLVADTAKTDGWTLARQNLATFRGDLGCGLADGEPVVDRDSLGVPLTDFRQVPEWVPPTPVTGLARYVLGPTGRPPETPFPLPSDNRFGLFVAGTLGTDDRLSLEFSGRGVLGASEPLSPETVTEVMSDTAAWHFFGPAELPDPPAGAETMRIVLTPGADPGPAVAVTAPVAFSENPLVDELRPERGRTLVLPAALMYLPCIELPHLANGVVEVPRHIVSANIEFTPLGNATSPFVGLFDLYPIERVPWADLDNPPAEITVYRVDPRIPGAIEVPALRATG